MSVLENLDWVAGKPNPSGIQSTIYAVKKSLIKIKPVIKTDTTGYEGDIELADGAQWIKIYSTQGVGKVEFDMIGEKDGKQPVNKASFFYPDINAGAKRIASAYCNDNIVYVVPHNTSNGVEYVILGLEFDATSSFKGTSGDKPGSQKGLSIEVEAPDFIALPTYGGVLETSDGSLNCATSKFTPKP